jgi:osmotically-inducible protein OsmY
MEMKKMSKHWTNRSITAAAVLLGVPAFADQPEDAYPHHEGEDGAADSEGVEPLHINVDTLDGVVTLHGQVETAAAKTKAADEAAAVKGVKDVRNMLAVVPSAAKESVAASDDTIDKQVKKVIENDAALKESSIKVASVHDGTVLLSGKADTTLVASARADGRAKRAGRAQGRQRDHEPRSLGDKEIWSDEPASHTAGVKNSASDAWITTKVKVALIGRRVTCRRSRSTSTRATGS